MKSFLCFLALLVCSVGSALRADTVVLLDSPYDGGLPGGEFTAVTSGNGTFSTFCLEYTSAIYTGFPYVYAVSGAAVTGGNNHAATPGFDTLSQGSAYLYTLLHFNQLAGYATTAALHKANAGALQKAFWALEDEWTFSAAGGAANPYLALVTNQFGTFSNAQNDNTGTEVQVMNIDVGTQSDRLPGTHRQDQLVYVPDGGTTIALFGLALIALGAARWRLG